MSVDTEVETLPVLPTKEEELEKIPSLTSSNDLKVSNIIAIAKRKMALSRIIKNGIVLILTLWLCTIWLFGGFYNSNNHVSQLEILVADFDGGSVGSAFLSAISTLNGSPTSPTFTILQSNLTSPNDLLHQLFEGRCWGIIYTSAGSTNAFENALIDENRAVNYRMQNAIVYSGLEVRYSASFSGYILPAMLQVTSLTSSIFSNKTVAPLLLKANTPSQISILLNPISSTFVNLTPFNFGSRVMFNTLGTVLPILLQFFFILGMNGIMTMTGLYTNTSVSKLVKDRLPIQLIWTLLTSISYCAWVLIFQETYTIGTFANFLALWTISFVFAFITFDFLDGIISFTPLPFQPPVVVTFILLSVASTSLPIELQSSFYKIHYIFFPHSVWSTMIVVFGQGASGATTLPYNLPILAGWLVGAKVLALLGLRKRCRVVIGGAVGH